MVVRVSVGFLSDPRLEDGLGRLPMARFGLLTDFSSVRSSMSLTVELGRREYD